MPYINFGRRYFHYEVKKEKDRVFRAVLRRINKDGTEGRPIAFTEDEFFNRESDAALVCFTRAYNIALREENEELKAQIATLKEEIECKQQAINSMQRSNVKTSKPFWTRLRCLKGWRSF